MRLEELIERLAQMPAKAPVYVGEHPAMCLGSYRGFYDQLTIFHGKEPVIAGELLRLAKRADGGVFQGWKGGDYTMSLSTTVWGDDAGNAYSTALAAVEFRDGVVHIDTFDASDYLGF